MGVAPMGTTSASMTSDGGWPLARTGAKSGAAGRGPSAGVGGEPGGDDPAPMPPPRVSPTPTPATIMTATAAPSATRIPRRGSGVPGLVELAGSACPSAALGVGLGLAPGSVPASSSIRGDANPPDLLWDRQE